MSELCVIGNGFDLWHGLPTSYGDFYNFAKATLDEVEGWYALDLTRSGPWSDFENSLGDFLWREFYDEHNHIDLSDEGFRQSFVYALEDDLTEQADRHVEAIRSAFREWIEGINIASAKGRLNLPEDALFISFNYTSTLENIYGIEPERILCIHGKAEGYDELIFGHGDIMEEEPELDDAGDSNRTMFSDSESAAKYPFYAFQKPISEVLDKSESFFCALEQITRITVIGHSLNEIDLPYFRKLAECVPNATWRVCCYSADEQTHHVEQLVNCGVQRECIQVCSYDNLEVCR